MTAAIQPGYPLSVPSLSAPISLRLSLILRSLTVQCPSPFLSTLYKLLHSSSNVPLFCLFALFSQSTFFVFNTFWPLLQKQGVYPEPFEPNRSRANCFRGLTLPDLANSFIVGVSFPSKMRGVPFCRSKRQTQREKENSRHPVWCRSHWRVHREADAREAGH